MLQGDQHTCTAWLQGCSGADPTVWVEILVGILVAGDASGVSELIVLEECSLNFTVFLGVGYDGHCSNIYIMSVQHLNATGPLKYPTLRKKLSFLKFAFS